MKFLHLMTIPSSIYNHMIVKMINDENCFISKNHKFLFTNKMSFEISCEYQNIELDEHLLDDDKLEKFNIIIQNYDFVLLHALNFKIKQFLHLKEKNNLKKIIWCVWGHDLYIKKLHSKSLYRNLTFLYKQKLRIIIRRNKVKNFKGIAIGFQYDHHEVYKQYGKDIKIFKAPYGLGYSEKIIEDAVCSIQKNTSSERCKVMIGHCAFSFLNHENLLNKLRKFDNEKITISLPLSYGDNGYAEMVEMVAKDIYQDKVEIIRDFMKPQAYLEYLNGIDVAIFDYTHQAALANIYLLLYLGKKVFLNSEGVIYKALVDEKVQVFDVDNIGTMDYDDFTNSDFDRSKGISFAKDMIDEKIIRDNWRKLFEDLRSDAKYG